MATIPHTTTSTNKQKPNNVNVKKYYFVKVSKEKENNSKLQQQLPEGCNTNSTTTGVNNNSTGDLLIKHDDNYLIENHSNLLNHHGLLNILKDHDPSNLLNHSNLKDHDPIVTLAENGAMILNQQQEKESVVSNSEQVYSNKPSDSPCPTINIKNINNINNKKSACSSSSDLATTAIHFFVLLLFSSWKYNLHFADS